MARRNPSCYVHLTSIPPGNRDMYFQLLTTANQKKRILIEQQALVEKLNIVKNRLVAIEKDMKQLIREISKKENEEL